MTAEADTEPRQTAVDGLALFARIGRDHAVELAELGQLDRRSTAMASEMWAVYERHWHRFCGSQLDPQHCRLDHPAQFTGAVRVVAGAPVVVVGTGPSLRHALPTLRRLRAGFHLITSPRGADVLASGGLVPDLVLVEHQTALDAHFSTNDRAHRPVHAMTAAPLVAANARTPAALLRGVSVGRLFVPDACPTWGLWPATAVGMALAAGAGAVGLLGIDIGRADAPDPRQAPLAAALALLAQQAHVACVDLGSGGAAKAHWSRASLDAFAAGTGVPSLVLDARPWLPATERCARAREAWRRMAPLAALASRTLAAALQVRDGDATPGAGERMLDTFEQLLASGCATNTRVDVQDSLGVSFLPRFWRRPPDRALGARLWRSAALASHEVTRQHETLGRRVERVA